MHSILRKVAAHSQTIRQKFSRIDRRRRLQLAIVLGIVGVLVFGFGVYNSIDATNRYNDLDSMPTPDAEAVKQMSQADLMVVAQVGIAKRDLLTRRAQSSSAIGIGAAILGVATLIFVSLPEQSRSSTSATPAASTESRTTSAASREPDANANPGKPVETRNA